MRVLHDYIESSIHSIFSNVGLAFGSLSMHFFINAPNAGGHLVDNDMVRIELLGIFLIVQRKSFLPFWNRWSEILV